MSKYLERARALKKEGKDPKDMLDETTKSMPGNAAGSAFTKSTRGGIDGGNSGRKGQRLQLPWDPAIVQLCERMMPAVGEGDPWPAVIAWDVDGDYPVAISIRRLSEKYRVIVEETPSGAKEYDDRWTNQGETDEVSVHAPHEFLGANDDMALKRYCAWLGGRVITIDEINRYKREVTRADNSTVTFNQSFWDYRVGNFMDNTFMAVLHNWNNLDDEEKEEVLEGVSEFSDPDEAQEHLNNSDPNAEHAPEGDGEPAETPEEVKKTPEEPAEQPRSNRGNRRTNR